MIQVIIQGLLLLVVGVCCSLVFCCMFNTCVNFVRDAIVHVAEKRMDLATKYHEAEVRATEGMQGRVVTKLAENMLASQGAVMSEFARKVDELITTLKKAQTSMTPQGPVQ